MSNKMIAGLDIGSNSVRLVVGQFLGNDGGNKFQIIGAVEAPTLGMSKGIVNSIEDVTSSISACLEKCERLIGSPVESVWLGINFPSIKCERSRGVVAVGRSDGEISNQDVERAVEAARTLSVPPNHEIIHVLPVNFTIDNQENIKDPVGMTGVRLEVETLIIQGLSNLIKNLTKAVYRTGLEIDDVIISTLAASELVMDAKQKELGAVLINIGASTTSLAVFEEGELLHAAVLSVGSEHITSDIAVGLRCPISLAEKIKIEFGSADPENFTKKDEIDLSELLGDDEQDIDLKPSRRYVAEIIQARVEEIFEKVDEELKKIGRSGMLPAGAFLIGGGAKLDGMVKAAKTTLRLPACIGANKEVYSVIDKVNDPAFLSALGLAFWGLNDQEVDKKGIKWVTKAGGGILANLALKVRKVVSSLMP